MIIFSINFFSFVIIIISGVSFEFLEIFDVLLQFTESKNKAEVKKQLKQCGDLLRNKTEIFDKINNLTKSKLLCSILKILFSYEITGKNTDALSKTLTQIYKHVENCLTGTENASLCSSNFMSIFNSTLVSAQSETWKNFNSKILALCLKTQNSGDAVEELVDQIVTSIQLSELSSYFESVASYLNEGAAIKTFKALVELIFTNTNDFGKLQLNVIQMTNRALDTLPASIGSSNLKAILTEQNLSNLFLYSLENNNESMVELCYKFYLMSPTPNLLQNSNEKDSVRLLTKLVSLVEEQQYQKKICHILLRSDESLRKLFMQMISAAGSNEIVLLEDQHEALCSLVYVVIKLSATPEDLPKEFSKIFFFLIIHFYN